MRNFNIKRQINKLYTLTTVSYFRIAGASWVALYTLGCFHCHSVFSFSFERSGPCHRAADAIPIIIGRRAEQLENFLDISALSLYSFFARGWNTSLFCGMCCTSILQSCAK